MGKGRSVLRTGAELSQMPLLTPTMTFVIMLKMMTFAALSSLHRFLVTMAIAVVLTTMNFDGCTTHYSLLLSQIVYRLRDG